MALYFPNMDEKMQALIKRESQCLLEKAYELSRYTNPRSSTHDLLFLATHRLTSYDAREMARQAAEDSAAKLKASIHNYMDAQEIIRNALGPDNVYVDTVNRYAHHYNDVGIRIVNLPANLRY